MQPGRPLLLRRSGPPPVPEIWCLDDGGEGPSAPGTPGGCGAACPPPHRRHGSLLPGSGGWCIRRSPGLALFRFGECTGWSPTSVRPWPGERPLRLLSLGLSLVLAGVLPSAHGTSPVATGGWSAGGLCGWPPGRWSGGRRGCLLREGVCSLVSSYPAVGRDPLEVDGSVGVGETRDFLPDLDSQQGPLGRRPTAQCS